MNIEAILGVIGILFGSGSVIGTVILWKRQVAIEAAKIAVDKANARKTDAEGASITVDSALDIVKTLQDQIKLQDIKIENLQKADIENKAALFKQQNQIDALQRERVEILNGVSLLIGQLEERDIKPVWRPKLV